MQVVHSCRVPIPADARTWLQSSELERIIESPVTSTCRWEDDSRALFEVQAFRKRVAWEPDRITERLGV